MNKNSFLYKVLNSTPVTAFIIIVIMFLLIAMIAAAIHTGWNWIQ